MNRFDVLRPASWIAATLLAGCAERATVIDAVTGAPVAARVERLPSGRLLVMADGYEMRAVDPGAAIELDPLWHDRFMAPGDRPPPPPPREHKPCCPGSQAR